MIRQGDPVKKEDAPNLYFSSFEGKYTIIDNLDEKGEPIVQAHPEMYNAEYVYVTVVLRGTLHMIVGGAEIEMKANDYLAVMPCMIYADALHHLMESISTTRGRHSHQIQ